MGGGLNQVSVRMARWRNILVVLVVLTLQNCNESIEADPSTLGLDHFPLQVGDFRDYKVQQIDYRFNGEVDTSRFQLRENVTDFFVNEEGGNTFLVNRFLRQESEDPWMPDSLQTARKTAFQAIQVENNQPLVKLVFPAEEGKTWDGNGSNGRETDEYQMVDVFQPFTAQSGSEQFTNTITVIQNDFDDGITRTDIRTEVYALDIGLIYRSSRIVSFCSDPDCLGQEIIEIGQDWQQSLIDFGTE